MPNHYTTHVTIKGDAETIAAFKARHFVMTAFEDEPKPTARFDFNTVIPKPKVLDDTLSGTGEETHPQNLKAKAETGYLNWYQWCNDNWGTKWNSYQLDIIHDEPRSLMFQFDTAWGPPLPVLRKLMGMWPKLTFIVKGRDEFETEWSRIIDSVAA